MSDPISFFTLDDEGRYLPTAFASSGWSESMINGPAVVGAAARELEVRHGVEGFLPARLTVDLFAPVRREPITIETTVVRDGNRIKVADAELLQGGVPVARATLIQLRFGDSPDGEIWGANRTPELPPQHVEEELGPANYPVFDSDISAEHWTNRMGEHQGAGRKRYWHHPLAVVGGEEATGFQRAAVLSEATSLVTNWGSKGIGFINADLTVALSRLPETGDLGLEADDQVNHDGVGVGTATLYDRRGAFGTGVVVAVSNARRQIDFSEEKGLSPRDRTPRA